MTITGDAGADVSGYLAAYLLPFLTVAEPSLTDAIAYVIFVLVAGLVYVRSGLMQINPTVYLMGRRVLRASVPVCDTTKEVFVICSCRWRSGALLREAKVAEFRRRTLSGRHASVQSFSAPAGDRSRTLPRAG